MTGEITLTGNVLPVGGIKQKVLAAHSCGVTRVMLPAHNFEHSLNDIPAHVRDAIDFIPVSHIDEVIAHAFMEGSPLLSKL